MHWTSSRSLRHHVFMSKSQFMVLVGMLGLIAVFLALPIVAPKPVKVIAPKYEYKVEDIPDAKLADKLTELGLQGWELVFARRALDGSQAGEYELIFKYAKLAT